jgi:hypothetical protein
MAYCNATISHDNCAFDSNCGLTCDGIVQRELANDPSFAITPEFYKDFMESCEFFYWPNGCPNALPPDSISVGNGGGMELTPATVDSVVQAFTQGFQGGVLTYIPVVAGALAIIAVIHLISYSVSKS